MTWLFIFGIGLMVLSIVLILWLAFSAPEGWEDEDGFHYGPRP